MNRFSVLAVLAGLFVLCVTAASIAQERQEITIDVTGPVDRQEITYECQDDQMETPARITVDYINLPNGNLAIVPVGGHPTVFALTLANSGSKYVSKSLVWWTRGNRGDLYDELRGGVEEAYLCRVVKD
ncbi:MliC family protein [Fulvimarina sp. MAC8]